MDKVDGQGFWTRFKNEVESNGGCFISQCCENNTWSSCVHLSLTLTVVLASLLIWPVLGCLHDYTGLKDNPARGGLAKPTSSVCETTYRYENVGNHGWQSWVASFLN